MCKDPQISIVVCNFSFFQLMLDIINRFIQ